MNIATLCNTYQRKMWNSMISRKHLPFSIWDVITAAREKVYYMPYNGYVKFEITTQQCLKCGSKLVIGFRKNEFITQPCKCTNDKRNYATIEKLTTLVDTPTAINILAQFSSLKTRNLPNKINKWVSLGYTHNEAVEKVKCIQTARSKKSPAAKAGVREFSIRCNEYWIKKEYSLIDAQAKVSELQIKNGLDWYVERYGKDEGQLRFDQRIKQWLDSYNRAVENDPTILERKLVKLGRSSKSSLKVLQPIYNKYKHKFKIYLGVNNNEEYFIRQGTSIFFYDFTIPELKFIVEYNGSAWHPNREILSEIQLKEWRGIFDNATADAVMEKDNIKKALAESRGYTVVVVWDSDDVETSIAKIEQIIEQLIKGKDES